MSAKRKPTAHARAVAFFMKHAGSSYMPGKETRAQGKRRGAARLAKAEKEAAARGWTVEWRDDEMQYDPGDDSDYMPDEVLHAVLFDEHGDNLASLGGIDDPSREYKRVVEAELALEALHEVK